MKPSILIVDDEESIRSFMVELLQEAAYEADPAASAEDALEMLQRKRYGIIFTDLRMPGMDGIALLAKIKEKDPNSEVIVLTSHSSVASAVEALRLGAYDYLMKPVDKLDDVLALVERAIEKIARVHGTTVLQMVEKDIASGLEMTELYARAANGLARLFEGQNSLIWEIAEGGLLIPKSQNGFSSFDKEGWTLQVFDMPAMSGLPPPEWQQGCLLKLSMTSAMFSLVMSHEKFLALIGVFSSESVIFSDRERDLLGRFAGTLSMAMENAARYADAKALSIRDALTGLYNRRYFDEVISIEIKRALRHQQPIALLFMDVDFFKNYNDTQGHPAGDTLLRQLAEVILKRVRMTDIVCRYGGEEIVLLLPHTTKENAKILAEELCGRIAAHPFLHREAQPGGAVTVSIGIAECPKDTQNTWQIVRLADEALYAAKKAGRNRVCLYAAPV